jgi:cellulose synthase/poly-beta-1,6-N-acetylglucosamine synthase-like glycosyltransferase
MRISGINRAIELNAPDYDQPSLSIVIPAYNESARITPLLRIKGFCH